MGYLVSIIVLLSAAFSYGSQIEHYRSMGCDIYLEELIKQQILLESNSAKLSIAEIASLKLTDIKDLEPGAFDVLRRLTLKPSGPSNSVIYATTRGDFECSHERVISIFQTTESF